MISPKPGPQRAILVSTIGQWALGATFMSLGCLSMVRIMQYYELARAAPMLAQMTILFLAPGIGHVTCAIFIARRRAWAISLAGTLISVYLVVLIFGVAYGIVVAIAYAITGRSVMFLFLAIVVAAFAILGRMRAALDEAYGAVGAGRGRAFEPVMPRAVEPVESEKGGPDEKSQRNGRDEPYGQASAKVGSHDQPRAPLR